ncbi:recombinase family protein [Streptomyces sp. NPDC058451]|uniref:recombinase family protein n=1 Tax=Streptomyces sp. NPDC058451 TaxID=3346506 RepID=UPI00365C4F66
MASPPSAGELIFTVVAAVAQMERGLIAERTRSALEAKRRRGEKVGGSKPTHTPEQAAQAMQALEKGDMTSQEAARAVGMSRSRRYALAARARAEQEQEQKEAG